MLLNILMDFNN